MEEKRHGGTADVFFQGRVECRLRLNTAEVRLDEDNGDGRRQSKDRCRNKAGSFGNRPPAVVEVTLIRTSSLVVRRRSAAKTWIQVQESRPGTWSRDCNLGGSR